LNAHRCLEEGIEPQSERAWLFKIAEHVVMYRRRTISRRARVEFPIDVDSLADLIVAPGRESPSELDALPEALARIPEAQQRAIVLREWYGLSYREVAAELDISASAAETLIFRARRRLAQELGGPAPTVRRRTPLGLASPLASFKWLVGGGTTVKALVGVTSVAVIAAGSTTVGLLEQRAPAAKVSAPQMLVARAATDGHQAVRLRIAVSDVLQIRRAGTHVRHRPAPAAVASAPAPVIAVIADPADTVAPPNPADSVAPQDPADSWVSTLAPPAAAPAGDDRSEAAVEPQTPAPVEVLSTLTAAPVTQLPAPVAAAGGPVETPPASPGNSGDAHGPNDAASSGQAQRSGNVPANAADPGNNGNGTPGGPGGPQGVGPGNNNGQGTPGGPAGPQASNSGNNGGGTPGGLAGLPSTDSGSNGQGNPGGPNGLPAAGEGGPQNGNTIPRPSNDGAPDLSALAGAAGAAPESTPPENAADSTARPASSDGGQPPQPQGDPAGSAVREPSASNATGNGAAADDAGGSDPAVAG
jgi:RNA polymerase sigma factor (sigma-70 family)